MSGFGYPSIPMTGLRIPLHQLRLQPSMPYGMNLLVVAAIAHSLRMGYDITDPIQVEQLAPGDWLVREGRHRFMAAYIAGVPDLPAVPVGT